MPEIAGWTRYIFLHDLPKYEQAGWRAVSHFRRSEEFDSIIVGWFGPGPPVKVKDEAD